MVAKYDGTSFVVLPIIENMQTPTNLRKMMRMLRFSIALMFAMPMLGCRDRGAELPTAPVYGTVKYNRKPLSFGKVIFFHPSGHARGADIAADGTFKLNAYQGENRVAVECVEADRPGSTKARSRLGNDKSLIPNRYANYSTSALTFEVKPGGDNKAAFTLKD
jgi:hypothetical protein